MSALFAAFGIDWRLLIIQAVNFALLLSVLTYFLYRPVLKIIDERRAKIAESVRISQEAAQRLLEAKAEGEGLVGPSQHPAPRLLAATAEPEGRGGSAAREAEGLVAAARSRADEKGNEIVQAAEARAHSLMKDAAARAEEAQRQALLESEREVARAAMLAAEKILRQKSA